jgi:hypothetical protein
LRLKTFPKLFVNCSGVLAGLGLSHLRESEINFRNTNMIGGETHAKEKESCKEEGR